MDKKLTTLKEIAKRLNVSISTVSRALHDHSCIGFKTKTRVQQLAKELSYEPNQTAIFFQQRKTFTIGVILPELSDTFFSNAISGIEDCANKNKYTVLMGQSHDNEEREKKIVETMKNHRVDGLLISISKNTSNYEHFEGLRKYDIPVVFFDRIPNMSNIHYVACNMQSGTIQAINFLINKGHRVIGMINGPEKLLVSQERQEGYKLAMAKNRLKFDPFLIISTDLSTASVHEATRQLLTHKRKPTAIIAFSDYVTQDAVQYARKEKRKINKNICFVSYGNQLINNYTAFPPLASVEQFPYKQGQKAMETLLELICNKKEESEIVTYFKIILDSQLIVHEHK